MKFRNRLEWLEKLLDRPRFGDGDGPRLIRIAGGLPGPLHATIGGRRLDCLPGETPDEFEDRALDFATKVAAPFLIVAGQLSRDA